MAARLGSGAASALAALGHGLALAMAERSADGSCVRLPEQSHRRLGSRRGAFYHPGDGEGALTPAAEPGAFDRLIAEVRACTRCAGELPLGPRPVVRGRPS